MEKLGGNNNSVVVITNHYSHLTPREKNEKKYFTNILSTLGAPLFVVAPFASEGAPIHKLNKFCRHLAKPLIIFSQNLPGKNSTI